MGKFNNLEKNAAEIIYVGQMLLWDKNHSEAFLCTEGMIKTIF